MVGYECFDGNADTKMIKDYIITQFHLNNIFRISAVKFKFMLHNMC